MSTFTTAIPCATAVVVMNEIEARQAAFQLVVPGELVEDQYAEDEDFASALNNLIGPDFEYPDWSHKTVGEVLEKYT